MKVWLIHIWSLFIIAQIANAQALTEFDLYNFDKKLINPAFTAPINGQTFNMFHKGYSIKKGLGAIGTSLITYDHKLDKLNSGLGMIYSNYSPSQIISRTKLSFLYSYELEISEELSFGLGLAFSNHSYFYDYSKLTLLDPTDPIISSGYKRTTKSLSLGLFSRYQNLTIAFSANDLFGLDKRYVFKPGSNELELKGIPVRVLNFYCEYYFVPYQALEITPSIMIEKDHDNWEANASLTSLLFNKTIAGASLKRINSTNYYSLYGGFLIKETVQILGLLSSYNERLHDKTVNSVELGIQVKI